MQRTKPQIVYGVFLDPQNNAFWPQMFHFDPPKMHFGPKCSILRPMSSLSSYFLGPYLDILQKITTQKMQDHTSPYS